MFRALLANLRGVHLLYKSNVICLVHSLFAGLEVVNLFRQLGIN